MKKKKVLVHGTLESINKFFSDAVSHDFDVVALLSEEPEKISVKHAGEEFEVFTLQSFHKSFYKLIDGIIFTDAEANKKIIKYFLKQKIDPRKIIIYDANQGWGVINFPDFDGTEVIYSCGLEFHIRNEDDEDFFKVIYSQLQFERQVKNLPPKLYPELLIQNFKGITGKSFDFHNPKTFTEKLQWLKIYDSTPLKTRLSDKYLVRNWITEKIGEQYLIPLLGVWNNFDDINFDDLPDQFVLKCNHGCGFNIIVRDKNNFDMQNAREKINAWLAVDYGVWNAFELHYSLIGKKIIAEKFMANGDDPDLTDYKFWCFEGKPVLIQCETDRSTDLRFDYFDMDFKHTNIERSDHRMSDQPEKISRPKNFELMKKIAAKLSEGFAFVRKDLYEIEGKVYFGEMTFTPGGGNFYYKSEGTDEYLGSLLNLPELTLPPKI